MPKILDLLTKTFLAFLPFSVFAAVFLSFKLGIPGVNYVKELLLLAIAGIVGYSYYRDRKWPTLDVIDYLIGGYVAWMLLSTVVNGGSFRHFAFGGRYDFEFLFAFVIFRHAYAYLPGKMSEYVRVFLISATAAICIGILVRFLLHEEILIHFGYSPNLSNWKFGGSVPIYHGIDGANVRRFQGIFDGPNPAAFFLITYLGVLFHFFRTKKEEFFAISVWALVVFGLVLYTYSRSALVGTAIGVFLLVAFSLKPIWKRHRKAVFIAIPVVALFSFAFYIKFEGSMDDIVLREGSSKGHFDRMVTGFERFKEHPVFGEGLATSGPAYRFVVPQDSSENLYEGETKVKEDYYIPESWYVQQLVEGGIPALASFVAILGVIAFAILRVSPPFFAAFVACAVMNLFLHSYESAYASLSLFALAGMYYAVSKKTKQHPGVPKSEHA